MVDSRPALHGRIGASTTRVPRGRVRPVRVLVGVLLVLVLSLAGVIVATRIETRRPVLAAARAVDAGRILTAADVRVVTVATDAGVATVPAAERGTVVGRIVTVPLVAGTLLAPAQFGGPVWPGAGEAVIAVPVKPGRLPAGLGAGAPVTVLVAPGTTPGVTAGPAVVVEQASAMVVTVDAAADQSGTTVVTLVLAATAATRIAATTGDVSLVRMGG